MRVEKKNERVGQARRQKESSKREKKKLISLPLSSPFSPRPRTRAWGARSGDDLPRPCRLFASTERRKNERVAQVRQKEPQEKKSATPSKQSQKINSPLQKKEKKLPLTVVEKHRVVRGRALGLHARRDDQALAAVHSRRHEARRRRVRTDVVAERDVGRRPDADDAPPEARALLRGPDVGRGSRGGRDDGGGGGRRGGGGG